MSRARDICRVTKDDHRWEEGLDRGNVHCAACYYCPSFIDTLRRYDRLAKRLEKESEDR